MRIAEDFERCEKCNGGWFEEKKFVLIDKNSKGNWGRPLYTKEEVQLHCTVCGHIQHKFIDHGL
jgi:hypothetical protein